MKAKLKILVLCVAVGLLIGTAVGVLTKSYDFPVLADGQVTEAHFTFLQKLPSDALVYTADGHVQRVQAGWRVTQALTGVIYDPPEYTNMDVYNLAASYLAAGERVLILYLDGFGYQSYLYAKQQGLIPNLSALEQHVSCAMMPSITPVNYAAMVTGKAPADNGITARGLHDLKCDTIFDLAVSQGKSTFIAEGNAQILRFNVPQELNLDMDEDGDTDTEVMACALEGMADADLALVHLHGIDDSGHTYGPRDERTLAKIAQTDAWFAQLAEGWEGRMIVCADHGQHANDGTGDVYYADKRGVHGAFTADDLLVPLLIK